MNDLPADSDGDAIRRVLVHGSDLSKPMKVDFHIAVASAQVGEAIACETRKREFECEVVSDPDGEFTVWCSKRMILSYKSVIDVQTLLSEIAVPLGGYSDGWGTLGNGPSSGANESS